MVSSSVPAKINSMKQEIFLLTGDIHQRSHLQNVEILQTAFAPVDAKQHKAKQVRMDSWCRNGSVENMDRRRIMFLFSFLSFCVFYEHTMVCPLFIVPVFSLAKYGHVL